MINTVQDLINALNEVQNKTVPVSIFLIDHDRYQIQDIDDTIDGEVDINVANYHGVNRTFV